MNVVGNGSLARAAIIDPAERTLRHAQNCFENRMGRASVGFEVEKSHFGFGTVKRILGDKAFRAEKTTNRVWAWLRTFWANSFEKEGVADSAGFSEIFATSFEMGVKMNIFGCTDL